MDEACRIGRPLGIVCAVLSGVIAASVLYTGGPRPFGPLTALGAVLVLGCTTATLLTSALEARQARAAHGQDPAAARRPGLRRSASPRPCGPWCCWPSSPR